VEESPVRNWARRARLVAALRRFLDDRGYLEVETPCLVPAPGQDPHLRCFTVADTTGRGAGFLRTSPEHAAKRLLARGLPRIYELAKVFRDEPVSDLHQPEFTMLEAYRAGATLAELREECTGLIRAAAQVAAPERLRGEGGLDLSRRPLVLAIGEILEAELDLDWRAHPEVADLCAVVADRGLRLAGDGWTWDAVFTKLLLEVVEPALPRDRIVYLEGFPACQASYARLDPADPAVADRWEVYLDGVELANAFGELRDATEQRRRFADWCAERRAAGGPDYPVDEAFLSALPQMPAAAGVALGVDRLALVLLAARCLDEVLLFPVDRPDVQEENR